jgi:hypothetical protein
MMNAIGVGAGLAAAAVVDWMRRKRRDAPTTSLNFPSSKA